jgi:hypothetical protein
VAEIRYVLPTRNGRPRKAAVQTERLAPPLPRITKLMALAIKLQPDVEAGRLDYKELAALGGVSRTRITQIFNLLQLAPDLQERLLWLEPHGTGREPLPEKALRRLSAIWDWEQQRRAFEAVVGTAAACLATSKRPKPPA